MELTELLQQAHAGDEAARERLFAVAYEELRAHARSSLVARIAQMHGAQIEIGEGFGNPGLSVRVLFQGLP